MMTVGKTTSYSVSTYMKKKINPKQELAFIKHLESEEELKSLANFQNCCPKCEDFACERGVSSVLDTWNMEP